MISNYFNLFLHASLITIGVAIVGLIFGMLLAFIFTALEFSKYRIVSGFSKLLTITLRGFPELLVVFFIYYGTKQVLLLMVGMSATPNAFWCGSIALAFIFAAYASQSLKSGLLAIPKGQWESSIALGLNRRYTFFTIIMPQMWKYALPGLSNQWLVLLKDTALVSLIGVTEILKQSQLVLTYNNPQNILANQPFYCYLLAGFLYLLITLISIKIINKIKKKISVYEKDSSLA